MKYSLPTFESENYLETLTIKILWQLLQLFGLLQQSRVQDCLHREMEQDLDVQEMQLSFMIQSVSLGAIMAM